MENTQWSSLLVPSVQELVKEPFTTVPSRYLHDNLHHHLISHAESSLQVPVIDMQKLSFEDFTDSELQKLHLACKEWGFFQLVNHGVLLKKVKMEIEHFFKMPVEEKKKYWQREGEIEGFGQAFVVSEEQKLDWADMFFITTLPTYLRRPHLFPNLPLSFRDTLEEYSKEMKNLAMKILYLIAKALGIEQNDMSKLFEEGMQSMRMNYYPPCPQPELVTGLNPHSDGAGLTILLQINEVEGLQVKKDGMWVPVKPIPNAFVINIGDMLEVVTNGVYRSIEHRAMVNSVKERLSVATFYSPDINGEVGPAPSLVDNLQNPALFNRIKVADYLKGFFARELQGKYIDQLRIQ